MSKKNSDQTGKREERRRRRAPSWNIGLRESSSRHKEITYTTNNRRVGKTSGNQFTIQRLAPSLRKWSRRENWPSQTRKRRPDQHSITRLLLRGTTYQRRGRPILVMVHENPRQYRSQMNDWRMTAQAITSSETLQRNEQRGAAKLARNHHSLLWNTTVNRQSERSGNQLPQNSLGKYQWKNLQQGKQWVRARSK